MELPAVLLDLDVLGAPTEPHLLRNAAAHLLTSWRWSPRYACDPSRDGDEGPHDHHGSSCEHESRACAFGSCYAADTYASRHLLRRFCGAGSILIEPWSVKQSQAFPAPSTKNLVVVSLPLDGVSPSYGSSIADEIVLQSRNAICYVRQTFSCGQLVMSGHGSTPEEGVDNFWIGCTFACGLREVSI
jgi:hypothetical protein